jgi:hypothetical protein
MLSAPAPTPPPPPHVRTDTGVEPDEQWKADLRKRIQLDLLHMVEDSQIVRDTILGSQPSESSRERALRDYEESMNNIRTLAQEEFTRQLRQEMSERKWALDVVSSNSPDVARQQKSILDNIRKADEDEERESGELGESVDEEGEVGEEVGEEVDHKPRQLHSPSPPSVSMTQPLHSKSPVSRRNVSSHQRQPPNPQPAEDNDDDDADDPHRHPPWRHESQGSQPYSPGVAPRLQSSGAQAAVWRPFLREPVISRASEHANGQVYNTPLVQFPRRGSVNSTGSNSSGAGLHRAGSVNSDHYRTASVAPHGGSERPSTQSRHRTASTFPTAPKAIPGARPSLDEANFKEEEASKKEEEARRLEEKARQSLEEARRLEACARQADASAKVREAAAQSKEAEVKHKEAEAKKREAAAQKREAEAQRREEDARKREEEVRRKEEEARKKEDEARRKEEEARRRKEEAKRIEEEYERKKREIERREVELKKREPSSYSKKTRLVLRKRKQVTKPWRVLDLNLKSLPLLMRTPPDLKPRRPPGQTQTIAPPRKLKALHANKRSNAR